MLRSTPNILRFFARTVPRTMKTGLFADKTASQPTSSPGQSSSRAKEEVINRAKKLVEGINETNKIFLGIKLNTNYLKVHSTMNIEQIEAEKVKDANVNELPFSISSSATQNESKVRSRKEALKSKAAEIVFARNRIEPIEQRVEEIAGAFLSDFAQGKRLEYLEPNFQRYCINIRKGLKGKVTYNVQEQAQPIKATLQEVVLMKGVSVYRNDNYSSDSYGREDSEEAKGIVLYSLFRQEKEEYPEQEWFSTKKITARLTFTVTGGPVVQVTRGETQLGSTRNTSHRVVVEADMVLPPLNSEHQVTAQQFLQSYKLRAKNLLLTNFDHKNPFFAMAYSESEKKSSLINRVVADASK